MSQFVKVGTTAELAKLEGSSKIVEAAGQTIAVFNLGGSYHAIENTCTHSGGPLGEGFVEGDQVTCPWHGAQFSIKTGDVLGPPAPRGVRSFPVRVSGEDVEVEV